MLNTLLVDILNAWLGYMMVRKYEIEERILHIEGGLQYLCMSRCTDVLVSVSAQPGQAATLSFYPLGLKLRLLTVTYGY